MALYFWTLLIVVVLPLVEGALLALVLREVYMRHPLPLGGTIAVRKTSQSDAGTGKSVEKGTESVDDAPLINSEEAALLAAFANSAIPADSTDDQANEGQQEIESAGVSYFDGTEKNPDHLPINDVLGAMTAESTQTLPNDFERLIEESAHTDDEIKSELQTLANEMDLDDLLALEAALPGRKIDFPQEVEAQTESSDTVLPAAKEILGEQFDYDSLEKETALLKQSLYPSALDIQENEPGTVHVSSPFMSIVPQLADLTEPQTIFPTFSSDWIQETNGVNAPVEGDLSLFCFTEESRPMFVRKKKNI